MSNGEVPRDDNNAPALGLWDPVGHQIVPAQAVSIVTDSTGQKYGTINVNASFSASSMAINDPNTTSQKASVSAGGSLQVAGQGTAGTPGGGVVSIQGVAGGTAIPISGTISATNPSVSTDGSAIPTSSTLVGASDGANLQPLLVESASNRNLRTGLYSGANEATVTGANALKVDNSAVTQPVSQLAAGSVSGTLQTAQAGNANGTPLTILGMGVAVLTVNMTGFTGTVNFEGQEDGTNFGALNAVLIGTNTITSTAVGATTTSIARYEIPVAGLQQIQARTSAVTAGTVTVTAHAVPVPYNGKVVNANITNANANGQNVMANSSPIVGASDWIPATKQNFTEIAGVAAGSVTSTATPIINSFDCSAYRSWSFQMTGVWTMTLQVQFSNDNANFSVGATITYTPLLGGLASSISSNGMYMGHVLGRYMRIIPTAWTSNASGVGTLEMYTYEMAFPQIYANENGVWTVQPGNTANTTPWLVNGANNNGVVAAAAGSVTVLKASAGVLACATITTAGTVATNIFDNASAASGTVLLALPATTTLGQTFTIPGVAKLGITAAGSGAGAPGYTVYFS